MSGESRFKRSFYAAATRHQTLCSKMSKARNVRYSQNTCPVPGSLMSAFYQEWYGKLGRGSWLVKRAAKCSKISMNVSVEYQPPRIPDSVWAMMTREQELETSDMRWIEIVRSGQEWTGEKAELLASERQVNNTDAGICDGADGRSGRNRGTPKKIRASSISTSSSNSDVTPLTPKLSSDGSPVQVFSPLTPPHSDVSFSSDQGLQEGFFVVPEAPALGLVTPGKGRHRSATTSSSQDSRARERIPANKGSRGRGRGGRRNASTSEMPSSQGQGCGRGERSSRPLGNGRERKAL